MAPKDPERFRDTYSGPQWVPLWSTERSWYEKYWYVYPIAFFAGIALAFLLWG